jgi:hypothetical protein
MLDERYVRPPVPVHFPESAEVPETKRHLELRTLLYQLLKLALGDGAAIGCDQFVYWDPTDPRQCLAPDAFVRMGTKDDLFPTWKVWERGAPHVAVEILSEHDSERDWAEKLERYRRLGISELVRFDPDAKHGALRVWDAVGHDLVERQLDAPAAQSRWLPGYWVIVTDASLGPSLRLSRDKEGKELYATAAEAGEARVRELEAELRRRDQGS